MTTAQVYEGTQLGAVFSLAATVDGCGRLRCYAATENALYCSGDSGGTWSLIPVTPNPATPIPLTALAASPQFSSDRALFAASVGVILRSEDEGETWYSTLLPTPPPIVSGLAVPPDYIHEGTLFAASMDDGVFRSADRGLRWSAFNFGLLDLHVNCLALSPNYGEDEALLAGTESGIFESTNGARSWREVNFPMEIAPVLSIAYSPNYTKDHLIIAGTESSGIWVSCDSGCSWQASGPDQDLRPVNVVLADLDSEQKLRLVATTGSMLMESSDGGATWATLSVEPPLEGSITSILAPMGLGNGSSLIIGLTEGGVREVRASGLVATAEVAAAE